MDRMGIHLTSCWPSSNKKNARKLSKPIDVEPKVLIIGAGAAGLSCAMELKRCGFKDVEILESSYRIGGRIWTKSFFGNSVDIGAQWIYGEENNVVYQMVNDKNLLGSSGDLLELDWIYSNGDSLSKATVKKLIKIVKSVYENQSRELTYEGSFAEYLEEKFLAELKNDDLRNIDNNLALEFLRTFQKMEGAGPESHIDDVSGFDTFERCHGRSRLNWGENGFQQFLRLLVAGDEMNTYGELTECITFNSRVTRIEWDRLDGTVMVYCENKKSYIADHVVVTVSLGVLKKNPTLFQPRLCAGKRRAIDFIGFGYVCKIFIAFETPFWNEFWAGFNAVWTKKDLTEIKSTNLAWISDIYGFYCFAGQPNVLQAWSSGVHTELIETLKTVELTDGLLTLLRKFFPTKNVSGPIKVETSKWTIDPAFMGSYSYFSVLTKQYNTGPEELSQPVNLLAYEPIQTSGISLPPMTVRPVLLFAGEATSPNHYSTVHGAVETGIREAHRLSGYYLKDL